MPTRIRITRFFLLNILCSQLVIATASSSLQTANSVSTGNRVIFLDTNANQGYAGNLGGTSGADVACDTSPDRPDFSKTYKALLLYKRDGSNEERYPCTAANQCGGANSKNWVLQPNTTYYNTSSESIGTTDNNGIFTFPLSHLFSHAQAPTSNTWITYVWTGAWQDWTPAPGVDGNCDRWSTQNAWHFGATGNSTLNTANSIGQDEQAYGLDCHLPLALYCVEQ